MKRKNYGKVFEKDFMDSIPSDWWKYRLMDWWIYWWYESRFTPSNICDLLVKDYYYLRCIELKTTKSKSITIPRQLDKLVNNIWPMIQNVFVINFREYWETYIIYADEVREVSKYKKSINIDDCRERWVIIPQRIVPPKRTKVTYDVEEWIKSFVQQKV